MSKKITNKSRRSVASELGRRGGLAVAKKLGKGHMKRIGRLGAKARWGAKTK